MIPIEQAAIEISRESIYSTAEILSFLSSALRHTWPIVRECTHVSGDQVERAKAVIQSATAGNIRPSSLIPRGGL